MTPAESSLIVKHRGIQACVRKNAEHPEQHLWIDIDGKTYFLGVLVPGMTRRKVPSMAKRWLAEHVPA